MAKRSSWATGNAVSSRMNRMSSIQHITVHHDGMSAFTATSGGAARSRIDSIRRGHQGRGWGDIGYHYLIDPGGRVWEGRTIAYQGAHVRDQNRGNIGICVMGNYNDQTPNRAQLEALNGALASLMASHGIPVSRVHTHRELAPTACPGRTLQAAMNSLRSSSSSTLARA